MSEPLVNALALVSRCESLVNLGLWRRETGGIFTIILGFLSFSCSLCVSSFSTPVVPVHQVLAIMFLDNPRRKDVYMGTFDKAKDALKSELITDAVLDKAAAAAKTKFGQDKASQIDMARDFIDKKVGSE